MPKRIIQAEVADNNLIAEIEMEETIPFRVLLARLRSEGHLPASGNYFIKNSEGATIRETDQLRLHRTNQFVITQDKDWKPAFLNEVPETEIETMCGKSMAGEEGWIWILPVLGETSWTDLNLQTQLFEADHITCFSGKDLSVRILVQYSIIDIALAGQGTALDRVMKMKQILSETMQIDFRAEKIDEKNFMVKKDSLEQKMLGYLSSYMELKRGSRIHFVHIAAYKHS